MVHLAVFFLFFFLYSVQCGGEESERSGVGDFSRSGLLGGKEEAGLHRMHKCARFN